MTKIDQELRQLGWYELSGDQDSDVHRYGFFGDSKNVPQCLELDDPIVQQRIGAYAAIYMDHEVTEEDDLWPYFIFDFATNKRQRDEFGGLSLDELEAFYKKTKEFVKIKKCERTKRLKTKGASNDVA